MDDIKSIELTKIKDDYHLRISLMGGKVKSVIIDDPDEISESWINNIFSFSKSLYSENNK